MNYQHFYSERHVTVPTCLQETCQVYLKGIYTCMLVQNLPSITNKVLIEPDLR